MLAQSSCDPRFGIGRIEEMPKAVFGVAIFLVIDSLAEKRRFSDLIAHEERVPLGGNSKAPQLPLPIRLWVKVIIFDLEN